MVRKNIKYVFCTSAVNINTIKYGRLRQILQTNNGVKEGKCIQE